MLIIDIRNRSITEFLNGNVNKNFFLDSQIAGKLEHTLTIECKWKLIRSNNHIFLGQVSPLTNQEELSSDLKRCQTVEDVRNVVNLNELPLSLVVIDLKSNTVEILTDYLNTYRLYYHVSKDRILVACNIFEISDFLKQEAQFPIEINENSAYRFLGFGYYFGRETLVKDVYQTEPSGIVTVTRSTFNFDKLPSPVAEAYVEKVNCPNLTEGDLSDKIERSLNVFKQNVELAVAHNLKNSGLYTASLSGGFDCKSTVCFASKASTQGNTLTFGDSKSLDIAISREVALGEGLGNYSFYLNGGGYLVNLLEEFVHQSSGAINAQGNLHAFTAFKNFYIPKGNVHLTGQIGDVVFGSFLKNSGRYKASSDALWSLSYLGGISPSLKEKISFSSFDISRYEDLGFELMCIETRQSCGTLQGDQSLSKYGAMFSPFTSKAFIREVMSIPDNVRDSERLYFNWMARSNTSVLDYRVDKTNAIPNSFSLYRLQSKVFGFSVKVRKALGVNYYHQNPFDKWFRKNNEITAKLDDCFTNYYNVCSQIISADLASDIQEIYQCKMDRYRRNKFAAVTLLIAMARHHGVNLQKV